LIPISPICDETVMPCIGRPVCVVMLDGTSRYGILRGIGDGNLYLDGLDGDLTLSALQSKNNKKNNAKKDTAKTAAFFGGFGGFGFGAAALSLALIASLFLIPFWI
jgi:hypothetical protein